MLEFRSVTVRDLARLRRYYSACNYQLCEYSAGTKLMWRGYLNPRYAEVAGCLVVLNTIGGTPSFDYPIPGPEGDVDAALAAMEDYCVDNGIVLTISVVPEEFGTKLAARYPRFCFARCLAVFVRRKACNLGRALHYGKGSAYYCVAVLV